MTSNNVDGEQKINCSTCNRKDVPNWDGKGHCITCARDSAELDEILELLHNSWLEDDYDGEDPDAIEAKQALLTKLAQAYKKGYEDGSKTIRR